MNASARVAGSEVSRVVRRRHAPVSRLPSSRCGIEWQAGTHCTHARTHTRSLARLRPSPSTSISRLLILSSSRRRRDERASQIPTGAAHARRCTYAQNDREEGRQPELLHEPAQLNSTGASGPASRASSPVLNGDLIRYGALHTFLC